MTIFNRPFGANVRPYGSHSVVNCSNFLELIMFVRTSLTGDDEVDDERC